VITKVSRKTKSKPRSTHQRKSPLKKSFQILRDKSKRFKKPLICKKRFPQGNLKNKKKLMPLKKLKRKKLKESFSKRKKKNKDKIES
jgi:hypothetical protein